MKNSFLWFSSSKFVSFLSVNMPEMRKLHPLLTPLFSTYSPKTPPCISKQIAGYLVCLGEHIMCSIKLFCDMTKGSVDLKTFLPGLWQHLQPGIGFPHLKPHPWLPYCRVLNMWKHFFFHWNGFGSSFKHRVKISCFGFWMSNNVSLLLLMKSRMTNEDQKISITHRLNYLKI